MTAAEKVWRACQALGDMTFSFTSALVLIEIQDTLKSSPPKNKVMKKAYSIGIATTTVFYLLCGCIGYVAFGNDTPGDLLTGFGFFNPYWLVDFGNICISLRLIGAYQVFMQPFFAFIEVACYKAWPHSTFVNREYYPLSGRQCRCRGPPFNRFRLVFRSGCVILSVVLAIIFPLFNSFLGLIRAACCTPPTALSEIVGSN
ncbi:hypothetical protein V2J09_007444 [Rumex salicifolius]